MIAIITSKLTFQAHFLNRGKYEDDIEEFNCLFKRQEFSLFHLAIP